MNVNKIILLTLAMSLLTVGCTSKQQDVQTIKSHSIGILEAKKRNCSHGNPFSEGGGHYAGYEWAQANSPVSCGGNSQSFIEGCEEYLEQVECEQE